MNASPDWRQPAETSGTTLAVIRGGVEKSTLHSTRGRPKLQPLALQKAPTPAEAGDSSGSSSAPSSGANGGLFSDLLTAALPAQKSDGSRQSSLDVAKNAETTQSQDADQADSDLAALAAASQIATRGVVLKSPPTGANPGWTDNVSLRIITTDDSQTNADIAADQASGAETTDEKALSEKDITAVDGGILNVQALINIAMTAAITNPTEKTTELPEQEPADVQKDAALVEAGLPGAALAHVPNDALKAVGLPATGGAHDVSQTSDVNALTVGETPAIQKSAKIAALQSVAWFEGASRDASASTQQDQAGVDSTADGTNLVASGQANKESKQSERNASEQFLIADRQPDTPLVATVSNDELSASDMSEGKPDDPAKADSEAIAEDLAPQTLLPGQAPAPLDIIATAQQALVQQAQQNLSQTAKQSGNDVSTPPGNEPTQASAPASASATAMTALAQSEASNDRGSRTNPALMKEAVSLVDEQTAIRGLAKPTVEALSTDATDVQTDVSVSKTDWTPNKTGPQDPDARNLEVAERKADDDKDAPETQQPHVKSDVNIRELLKLGATDMALSFEQPDLPPAPPPATEQPLPPLTSSSQQATPQQTAPIASANVETNGERRTIADDIRLRALERLVVNAARNGTQVLSIQLYPPGLGQVVLRLALDGQRLRLATRAATTEAADTLRNMEADLRESLAGNGLQLAGFDVSEDGTNDEAPRRQPVEPLVKTRSGGTKESFTVDLNA